MMLNFGPNLGGGQGLSQGQRVVSPQQHNLDPTTPLSPHQPHHQCLENTLISQSHSMILIVVSADTSCCTTHAKKKPPEQSKQQIARDAC